MSNFALTFYHSLIAIVNLMLKMGSSPSKGELFTPQEGNKYKMKKTKVLKSRRGLEYLLTDLTNVCLEDNSPRKVISKLEKALCWTSKHEISWSPEFTSSVNELLVEACEEMSRLTEVGNYSMADEIAKMILKLRIAWGSEVFEHLKIKSFPRERIETKNAVILAGQYFKPEQFYKSDDRICRLYFFEVTEAETSEFVFTYYLECSNILQKFHVLCLACSGGHLQVVKYGKFCPSYWTVREDMLRDFSCREESAVAKCDCCAEPR